MLNNRVKIERVQLKNKEPLISVSQMDRFRNDPSYEGLLF